MGCGNSKENVTQNNYSLHDSDNIRHIRRRSSSLKKHVVFQDQLETGSSVSPHNRSTEITTLGPFVEKSDGLTPVEVEPSPLHSILKSPVTVKKKESSNVKDDTGSDENCRKSQTRCISVKPMKTHDIGETVENLSDIEIETEGSGEKEVNEIKCSGKNTEGNSNNNAGDGDKERMTNYVRTRCQSCNELILMEASSFPRQSSSQTEEEITEALRLNSHHTIEKIILAATSNMLRIDRKNQTTQECKSFNTTGKNDCDCSEMQENTEQNSKNSSESSPDLKYVTTAEDKETERNSRLNNDFVSSKEKMCSTTHMHASMFEKATDPKQTACQESITDSNYDKQDIPVAVNESNEEDRVIFIGQQSVENKGLVDCTEFDSGEEKLALSNVKKCVLEENIVHKKEQNMGNLFSKKSEVSSVDKNVNIASENKGKKNDKKQDEKVIIAVDSNQKSTINATNTEQLHKVDEVNLTGASNQKTSEPVVTNTIHKKSEDSREQLGKVNSTN